MVAPCAENQFLQNRHPDNIRDSPQISLRSAGGGPTYWVNNGFPPTQEEINQTIDLIQTLENIIRSEQQNDYDINEFIQNFYQPSSIDHMH